MYINQVIIIVQCLPSISRDVSYVDCYRPLEGRQDGPVISLPSLDVSDLNDNLTQSRHHRFAGTTRPTWSIVGITIYNVCTYLMICTYHSWRSVSFGPRIGHR
jgi:hypothetical protein